jgi:Grx4 family monothiol glutaredoxin
VPFFTFHEKGALADTLEGADAEALAEKLNARLGGSLGAAPAAPAASAAEDLHARLKALTTSAPVLLFMKGTKQEPRCGFSRKVVSALADTGADFETFDILEDEEVRQGLKEYSDWPTYPQLYVQGELVGGCDIILEMAADGSLKETVAGAVAKSKEALHARLKALINKAAATVFIKGSRDEPRCGFSRKVVSALADTGADFETFDILEDEEVRQGLKEYSDWPTYPQLYVKGELVGGCDIILEMAADGSLKETLTAAA